VTAQLLPRGTVTVSPGEVEERLAFLGIEYSVEVQADYTIFSFSFLGENLEAALELISLFFVEPAFPPLELSTVKREFYYQLLRRHQVFRFRVQSRGAGRGTDQKYISPGCGPVPPAVHKTK